MIIDRIEGAFAVVHRKDGTTVDIALSELPEDVKEGSVLRKTADGYITDIAEERALRQKAAKRMRSLFRKK